MTNPQLISLPPGEVHLWLTSEEEINEPSLLRHYASLLTADEVSRHAAFRRAADRHRFLVTRALVRWVLSQYIAVAPASWQFKANAYGKPSISFPPCEAPAFNLSHTQGLVAMAVSRTACIGVDAENALEQPAPLEVASSFFTAGEAAFLREAPEPERAYLFFRLWTLKEAYIKARGIGLSIALDRFGYNIEGKTLRLTIDPHEDKPARWTVAQYALDDRHLVAWCAQGKIERHRAFWCIPFRSAQPTAIPAIGTTAP